MKKFTFLSILSICICSVSFSQINKGSVLLGGGVGISSNKVEDADPAKKSNYLSITPTAGIAIRQNTVAGLQLTYWDVNDNIYSAPQKDERTGYGAEVFLRKYVTLGKGFYLFGQGGIQYNHSSYTNTYPNYENKQKGWSIGFNLYPGISYAVSQKFHLEAGLAQLADLSYSKTKYINQGQTEKRSGINFDAKTSSLSNINIGFRVFLSK
jgi:hypothetical protein